MINNQLVLQIYLRDFHNYDITIIPNHTSKNKRYFVQINMYTFLREGRDKDFTRKIFDSYEEGLKAGIEYVMDELSNKINEDD